MQRLIGVVCVAIIITTPGCAGFGFLAHLVGAGEKIPASYKLADRPTAILVDDPDNALGAPALPGVIANNIRHMPWLDVLRAQLSHLNLCDHL